jgi:hypothetical protein
MTPNKLTRLALCCALTGAACQGSITSDGEAAEGLVLEAASPEDGLRGHYVTDEGRVSFAARVETTGSGKHLRVIVADEGGAALARMEGDYQGEPIVFVGSVQLTGLPAGQRPRVGPEEVDELRRLVDSPAGDAFARLLDELPWHVDGMHDEFLSLHTMYVSLRLTAQLDAADDAFSVEENGARVARLADGAARDGRAARAVTSVLPLPDLFICPGKHDRCVGSCGTGCQDLLGTGELPYTCECLRHDTAPNTAPNSIFAAAWASMQDPSKLRTRENLVGCASWYQYQSPSYFCSAYGSSETNNLSESSDGQWWCYNPYPGEELLSPGPQNLQTDINEHWGWSADGYRKILATDARVHHFETTGRITIGISGKASGVVVARISPGAKLCTHFDPVNGICRPEHIDEIRNDPNAAKIIEDIIDETPGCYRSSGLYGRGTTQTTGATCPDVPFYHKFAGHGFGWYAAEHIPAGDYIVALVSQSKFWGGYDGHATANFGAYHGIGSWQPMRTGACGATAGNGRCEAGEGGWNVPADCCDAYTPCGQSYMNRGEMYCRGINGGSYQWVSTDDYYCDEAGEVGSSTYKCQNRTYSCSSLHNWSLVQQCGNGVCESGYGETSQSCSADCGPYCEYYCDDWGMSEGMCDSGWECTGVCVEYTGCGYGGGGSCDYWCDEFGASPGQCEDGWECVYPCIEYTGCYW